MSRLDSLWKRGLGELGSGSLIVWCFVFFLCRCGFSWPTCCSVCREEFSSTGHRFKQGLPLFDFVIKVQASFNNFTLSFWLFCLQCWVSFQPCMIGCKKYRLLGCRVILQVIPYIRGFHILIPEIVWPLISHEGSLNAAPGEGRSFLSGISLLVFVYFDVLEEGFIHVISFSLAIKWPWAFCFLKLENMSRFWVLKYKIFKAVQLITAKSFRSFLFFTERVWCFSFKFTQYCIAKRLAPCVKKERHFDCRTLD